MKAVGILVAVTVLSTLTTVATAAEPHEPQSKVRWHADLSAAKHVVKEVRRPLLIFFTMDSCLYCKKISRLTYENQSVASTISRSFVATVVNGSKQPQLAEQYGVRIYPTTVILSPDGRVIDSITGYVDSGEMRTRLEKADQRLRVAMSKK